MAKSRVGKAAEWLRAALRPPPRSQPLVTTWTANPPPLPEDRIDIGEQSLEEQPPSCLFFRLPLELRQCIYELALGGRVVRLELVASRCDSITGARHYVVRSACYAPGDEVAGYGPNRLDVPAEVIPIALLFVCRQVYLEALPILHGRNTFHFRAHELEVVVLAALGRYCLLDLRSVYLFHGARFRMPWWADVAALLRQMRLDSLAFEFELDKGRADLTPLAFHESVLGGWWSSEMVKIRNLRRFEIYFTAGYSPAYPTYIIEAVQRMRDLMIGLEADERYRVLLEEMAEAERLEQQRRADMQP
ncbi:hypothetical protein FB451DRAFT_1269007 [Mycena latifolia]|nr:hypothetical protein FB451DRAFT_1269007 [Mycena latifolia]